ncbi:Rab11 [Hexamita inflata]|uniref:Rab11 n=1 Tax=Hexamita inflata TaxID=28002 RepID=A0AA86QWV0_9EUKA|nr:Rab11 [Hexamita inflata]
MNTEYDFLFKIIFIGAQQTGKSYTLNQIVGRNGQTDLYTPTIGIEFVIKQMQISLQNKAYKIKLQLWDTAGQERFKVIIRDQYRSASGIFLFCNVCDLESFQKCSALIEEIRKNNKECTNVMLVGNQIGSQRVVSVDELVTFAQSNNIMFTELNTENSDNENNILERMVKYVIHQVLLDKENAKLTKQEDGILI